MSLDVSHAPRFQLAGADTWADPFALYAALRDHDPVHHVIPDNPEQD
jgi:hypothetical protein